MDILVTGGAGYIGSHMCKYLSRNGYRPVVLDNLSRGHQQAVKWGPFFQGNVSDGQLLDHIFSSHDIKAVMHFAAFISVGESVGQPGMYYSNNVAETIGLLNKVAEHDVQNFIFSSSAAIFGEPIQDALTETHPVKPINPYGRGKLIVENIIRDFEYAHGLNSVCLRYFNAAGADPDGEIGEDHRPETHIIPLILQTALGLRDEIVVFGDDYPTKDGTCIRDYIHIDDLAQAHLRALERLLQGKGSEGYNIGNGNGYSVKEVIEVARRISGKSIPDHIGERREGDAAVLISSSEKAVKELGWKPRYADLESIVETAWNWHRKNPNGFED